MKPNYILIGASKCASSTICTLLGCHPDVFMVPCKETAFFSNDEIYAKGIEWYESLFDAAGDKKMRGEGSNRYTMKEVFPNTISRIVSYNPNLKLIYCVRNPISRIESYWLQIRSHGGEDVHYDFNKALHLNRELLVDSSNYWQQLQSYRNHFSDDAIHVVFFEDFKKNPQQVMKSCFRFLEVDPDVELENINLHIGEFSNKTMPREFLSKLRGFALFRQLRGIVPKPTREILKRKFLFKNVDTRPNWLPETQEWVANLLEEDSKLLLEYCQKPHDFWQLRP